MPVPGRKTDGDHLVRAAMYVIGKIWKLMPQSPLQSTLLEAPHRFRGEQESGAHITTRRTIFPGNHGGKKNHAPAQECTDIGCRVASPRKKNSPTDPQISENQVTMDEG